MQIRVSLSDIAFYFCSLFCIVDYFTGHYLSAIFQGFLVILNYGVGWYLTRIQNFYDEEG